ncbi:MAG: GlsB/YeaQ/YmgE family stress response membrane protein [Gemmatimonadales bacterium]
MGILWTILIGFLIGTVAKVIVPGKGPGGFIMTTVLGICGSVVGGWLAGLLGMSSRVGFIGSVVGAVVILYVHRWWNGRGA